MISARHALQSEGSHPLGTIGAYRPSPHSRANKIARVAWGCVWALLFRPSPKPFHAWRRMLLRLFGAEIGPGAVIHASARIWAPWNLTMGTCASLSHRVDCYAVDLIVVGDYATVSQYSFLCAASHDIDAPDMPLVTAPIVIGAHAWIAADAFVGPGVTIGEGAVVGARASAFRPVPPWTVVAGNPARAIRMRRPAVAAADAAGWHAQRKGQAT
ncbi:MULTISPECIES: putative colanic acid biosynthesis acetyltransferase [unclassified Chelatococcus]|uniref:putative colanic acid biosynthesis acetyltransferase n=1 Tax=unclassified Chelatococcus TaxID=2638111 RepID=UPI001BCF3010|nr:MULTISPECIES: putative colanic acid biosynthesis acetyltransferase [unclassified Chelatococcus]MBS7695932.1 putative colanic acid biosynthesis acetyltransferase [Chelatococcus sp. YT9]MBX3555693.1 putative colanic acid biosynthesis acetyltransferase [Chelatococcus sp.]